jgi:hypothetical protein
MPIIQVRRDTATNWTSLNHTLAQGEIGLETDTKKFKIGDGLTAWTSLKYISEQYQAGQIYYDTANDAGLRMTVGNTRLQVVINGVTYYIAANTDSCGCQCPCQCQCQCQCTCQCTCPSASGSSCN